MSDQAKKKNWFARHKIMSVILGLIVIGVITSAAGGNKGSTNTPSGSTKQASSGAKTVGIGQAAQDGKFEFTVNSFKCGDTTVGTNQYLTKTAQGEYCLMNLTVKNIGNQAQLFDASNEYVYDSSNNKLSADSTASTYANPDGSTFLNQINPGNSVTGTVAFDVAKGATIATAELHDSAFSSGVKVTLK